MYLLSVTLTNFKAHQDRHVEFQPGTNAICGENGAGKTSVLEGIAWTLFNYQGSYTKEDLIRNGSGSAQVRVAFVSARDSRTYEVERCTNRGYIVFDPQLNERLPYSRIKDEVLPWLRQHLGVPLGTDLAQLFANTIGIPQGTFTADFLLSRDKRKPIFDSILKVEEYRAAYQQSNGLRRYAESQVQLLKDQIAQYEERLEGWDTLTQRYQTLVAQIATDQTQLQQLEKDLESLQQNRIGLLKQAQHIQQLQQQQQQLKVKLEAKQQAQTVLQQALDRASQAVKVCEQHRAAFEGFMAADKALKVLDSQRLEREKLLKQQQQQQQQLDKQQANLTRLQLQLEQVVQIEADLEALQPQLVTYEALTAQQKTLQDQQQALRQIQLEQKNLKAQLIPLGQTIDHAEGEISRIQALEPAIVQIPAQEDQRQRLQQQLSRIEAAQQFEIELRQLVSAGRQQHFQYAKQVTAALAMLDQLRGQLTEREVEGLKIAIATGQTLNQTTLDALKGILQDLSQQVNQTQLTQALNEVQAALKTAYRQKATWETLATQRDKLEQLQQQRSGLEQHIESLTQQLGDAESLDRQLAELQAEIQALNDPPGRQRLLQKTRQGLASVQADYDRLKTTQSEIQQRITDFEQQLKQFADLEQALQAQRQLQTQNQQGYRLYLQHEQDAKTFPEQSQAYDSATVEINAIVQEQTALNQDYQALSESFDPQQLEVLEVQFSALKTQADQLQGSLPQQQTLKQELADQLAVLKALADQRAQAQADLKQREKTKRFINFARKVYKEAGPRITERYVQTISREADRLFRELLNRANVALEWTRDYEILVQEGTHTRRFNNLSGGEQMCAALAVRLALLKILADIDIAFFDEPTTNMDRPRRESLAESIARLKSFRQLFVISHDDTFEKVTENVIMITRES